MINHWLMYPEKLAQMRATLQATDIVQAMAAMPEERAGDMDLPLEISGSTATIPIRGVMTKNPGFFTRFFGGTSTRMVQKAVEIAAADKGVDTVIMPVDSPGGSVDGLAELGDAVFKARESVTVIGQVEGLCASAAYYPISQADKVFAGRMDMIGSIGTRLVLFDESKAFEEAGIETVVIDTGAFKSIGEPGTEVTDEQKAELQKTVNLFFADFKAVIARGRGRRLSAARLDEVADGRVFLADEAKALGLIDGIQTLDVTINKLSARRGRAQANNRLRQAQQDMRLEQANKGLKHGDKAVHNPV